MTKKGEQAIAQVARVADLAPLLFRHLMQKVLNLQIDQAVIEVYVPSESLKIAHTNGYRILRAERRGRK